MQHFTTTPPPPPMGGRRPTSYHSALTSSSTNNIIPAAQWREHLRQSFAYRVVYTQRYLVIFGCFAVLAVCRPISPFILVVYGAGGFLMGLLLTWSLHQQVRRARRGATISLSDVLVTWYGCLGFLSSMLFYISLKVFTDDALLNPVTYGRAIETMFEITGVYFASLVTPLIIFSRVLNPWAQRDPVKEAPYKLVNGANYRGPAS